MRRAGLSALAELRFILNFELDDREAAATSATAYMQSLYWVEANCDTTRGFTAEYISLHWHGWQVYRWQENVSEVWVTYMQHKYITNRRMWVK